MESLGKYLRSKRELKELSLEEVASVLKVKVWYLSAIEQDFFDLLPSGGYDRKFLTQYAEHLGHDSDGVTDPDRPLELPPHAVRPQGGQLASRPHEEAGLDGDAEATAIGHIPATMA
jgi:transcriptional regulator with XRE-family HTH domain